MERFCDQAILLANGCDKFLILKWEKLGTCDFFMMNGLSPWNVLKGFSSYQLWLPSQKRRSRCRLPFSILTGHKTI